MYNDVITLLKVTYATATNGDQTETVERKDVFAKVKSIGMREKYQAHAIGLKPEYTFELADSFDYDNEEFVEYDGIRYNVFRSYKKETNEIELTVMR